MSNLSDIIIVTSIYQEFWGTEQFRKSCARIGLPVYNAYKGNRFTGNGDALRMIYEAYVELKDKYKYAIYSDGADTFFLKPFMPHAGQIIYSAEKACYPDAGREKEYPDRYTPWCYLNAGNCCGEISLLIDFYETYGLNKYVGDINGQREQTSAYLQARKDNFPILLDQSCLYFQSIAFEDPGNFSLAEDGLGIINNITGSRPCVLHGNGRTSMDAIYQRYNL